MPNNGYIHYPYSISLLNRNFFIKAAEIYKKQVTARSNNTKYIIDKMPENITYAGFIKILLPDSKIVHCIRDLRDVALSLYSTHFRERSLAFANSQDDILYYIESYLMIVSHWKKIFPDMIVEIKYSDLLEDFENTTKKLFASCGIDWTKEVFDFHKSKNSVATASRAQVKQPLYKSSKDKWRNYKPYYAEFFHKIEDLANKYNYTW